MHDELTVLSHPARVQVSAKTRDADLLALVKERYALDDDVMTAHPPYFWRAEISSDLVDSHFTHMAESTLRNYAADADLGVAFLKGHDHRSLPIGHSLKGSYEDTGGKKRVVADFYTVAGLPETDDLILRMRSGILRDVSVGFHGGQATCDLCSRDFWDCPHMPGLRYEVKEGDTVRTKLATFTIENARLSEVSGVFDGSTPQAMILKAQERAAAGELTADQVRILEQRFRVKLPAGKRAFAVINATGQMSREAMSMDENELNQLKEVLGAGSGDALVRRAQEITASLTDTQKRIAELEPQAADGRQFRADLVAEAIAEGVRAQGKDFDKPTYEPMLTAAPIATIKRMRDDWQRIGDERLAGGRQSVDDDRTPPQPEAKTMSLVPEHAYKG